MTASVTGEIEATTWEPGWIKIPDGVAPAERTAWVTAAADDLRLAWGEAWDDRAASMVPVMLRESLEQRPDAHVVFEVWPFVAPARGRVRISMTESGSLPDWDALGFSLIPYDDAGAGPGYTVVRQRDETDADGEGVRLVDWGVVFDDGERALFVQVDTLPLFFFTAIVPGLHMLIGSLRVTLPDGTAFRARPTTHALLDDEAVWPEQWLAAPDTRGKRDEGAPE